jgi:RHH-type transcriptional regulator, proline utilization regulon repressor / proline dehydrogenase / delta 1-pyrroline-5-carboxylate dehydrogenase
MLDSLSPFTRTEQIQIEREVIELATKLQNEANGRLKWTEKGQQKELARMVKAPLSRAIFMLMTDQVFRLSKNQAIFQKFIQILKDNGVPKFFGGMEQAALGTLKRVGFYIPHIFSPIAVWFIKMVMKYKTKKIIIPGETAKLKGHLNWRKKQGLSVNMNHLGDMVLGEKEAKKHLEDYKEDLRKPLVECISVKISTLFSQINPVAHDYTVQRVTERLKELLRVALEEQIKTRKEKLVYLDLEGYQDLTLTIDVFESIMGDLEFNQSHIGIALQAYLPDSFYYQQEITELAKQRVADGGEPIRIRIVKGANMEMEQCIASLNNWSQAPYTNKIETDANYKRMLSYAFKKENMEAVKIGVASHNIFEISFAKTLQIHREIEADDFEFEMLEGMADHVRRSVQSLFGSVLLYAPIAKQEEFLNAIAYLVRRLVENTDEDNFLSHSFDLKAGSVNWKNEEKKFISSLEFIRKLGPSEPRFKQNRSMEVPTLSSDDALLDEFKPDSPTNFSLPTNQSWLKEKIISTLENIPANNPEKIPIIIEGNEIWKDREEGVCLDPSRPGIVLAYCQLANVSDIERSIAFSKKTATTRWDSDSKYRDQIFSQVAVELKKARAELISYGLMNVGKSVLDLDAEVSEAIDFTDYYPRALRFFREKFPHLQLNPKGTVVVISPWNFPVAIPIGGIIAALAAGNRVILKPSPLSILATYKAVECLWRGGVPKEVLQFIPCKDKDAHLLTEDKKVDFVVFTGSTATADKILKNKPDCDLSAETGGKNVTIVTDSADKELAIKQVVDSTFGYNGQKCSATSVLILVKEVYDDPKFRSQLKDAVKSLPVGPIDQTLHSFISPLITNSNEKLYKAFTELNFGEEWLVKPIKQELKNLWSPGVKMNVQPGSFTHKTEFFGPVLGLMRADNLEEACQWANQTGYGLTAGLQSLDENEINYFFETVETGNLYANNKTTGAIVGRQPFGGIKGSRRGLGGKAGGINYVLQFMNISENEMEVPMPFFVHRSPIGEIIDSVQTFNWKEVSSEGIDEIYRSIGGAKNYLDRYIKTFSVDEASLKSEEVRGQINTFRYRKVENFTIRSCLEDRLSDVLLRVFAGVIAGNQLTISIPNEMKDDGIVDFLQSVYCNGLSDSFQLIFETDLELSYRIANKEIVRLAYAGKEKVPTNIFSIASENGLTVLWDRPLTEGRITMLEQFYEQSLCYTYHRYGNLGLRGVEAKINANTNSLTRKESG